MEKEIASQITSDGLRYKVKTSGSPFGTQSNDHATMSCFKCGQHKPRSKGSYRMLIGKSTFFCGDCKPLTKSKVTTND